MTILESHLAAGHLFLLGGTQRPSIADFAMYGQLFQFCVMDTTYSLRVREEYAGRAFLYCMRIDDLSGTGFDTSIGLKTAEPEPKITQLPPTTLQLLRLIGQVYLPFLLANERACNTQGATKESYKVTFGEDWPAYIGQPFTYQRKCLLWLREHLGYALERAGYEERTALEGVLKESGCWEGLVNGEGGVLGTKLKGKI